MLQQQSKQTSKEKITHNCARGQAKPSQAEATKVPYFDTAASEIIRDKRPRDQK